MTVPIGISCALGDFLVAEAGLGEEDEGGRGSAGLRRSRAASRARRRSSRCNPRAGSSSTAAARAPVGRRRRPAGRGSPAATAAEVAGGVGDDPQEPGPEAAAAVEVVQVAERLDEPILHGIQRVVGVAEQAERHAVGDSRERRNNSSRAGRSPPRASSTRVSSGVVGTLGGATGHRPSWKTRRATPHDYSTTDRADVRKVRDCEPPCWVTTRGTQSRTRPGSLNGPVCSSLPSGSICGRSSRVGGRRARGGGRTGR